jgi:hypothetical protein
MALNVDTSRLDTAAASAVEAGAPAIEISPAMLEAGVAAVAAANWQLDSYEEMAISIYSAMAAASDAPPRRSNSS